MTTTPEARVQELLKDRSDTAIRELGVAALRRWRAQGPAERAVTMHGGLGLNMVELLAASKVVSVDALACKEVFLAGQQLDFMAPVMDFVWWLFRAGLARPGVYQPPGVGMAPALGTFFMTAKGLRLLDAQGDHPMLPGFIARLKSRHPETPESVLAPLEDAQACLNHALLRPAVVLLGVALEAAVESVLLVLATRGLGEEKAGRKAEAGERVGKLKRLLGKLDLRPEERRLREAAIDFADHLRLRRNDGAHTTPQWPFDQVGEVEELLVSAGRHLPHLLAIGTAPSVAPASASGPPAPPERA